MLSIMEHHSNIVPWHFLRERQGAVLKWAPVSDEGEFLLDEFERLISPAHQDSLLSLTCPTCSAPSSPIKEVVRIAHARGIPVLVDGAQGAVHMPVDVQDLDCDFYVFTGHKLYGPTGIGVLYGKKQHLETMPPYQGGGEMIGYVTQNEITYAKPPHRFEAGTPAIVQAIGLGAALDYVEAVGRETIKAHEDVLGDYAMGRLGELNWIRIFGRAKDKGGIVAFNMEGAHPHDMRRSLTAMAWRFAPAPIAPSRCSPVLA